MAEELKAARGRLEAALAEAKASWGGIPRDHTNVLVKVDDLRLLLRTPPSMRDEGWQPIEAAPKDRPILSTNRYGVVAIIMWWPHAFLENGGFRGAWDDGERPDPDESVDGYIEYQPTHWRPLPAPPGAEPVMRDDEVIEDESIALHAINSALVAVGQSKGWEWSLDDVKLIRDRLSPKGLRQIRAALQPKGRDDEQSRYGRARSHRL
jgi:hypothetical protein